ncbi:MAG: helix-turn-helix transcriptional regulator [Woeseiaceae bacterium]|jgi:DNA-binding XRE family transcriptional regulator
MGASKEVDFHNRIRLLRTERSISRKELAEAVGVHPQTIGYIERRQYNLSLALAFKLADYFGLSLDAVFSSQPFRPLSDSALKE